MTKPEKYVPKHRAPGAHKRKRSRPALGRSVRTSLVGVAAATATGMAVTTGMVQPSERDAVATAADAAEAGARDGSGDRIADRRVAERDQVVTRSDRRGRRDPAKAAALSTDAGPATTRTLDLSDADPRDIARAMLPEFGFDDSEFGCLDLLFISESNWRIDADNPTSTAYGIPQALTGLHDLPEGYMTSAEVQIRWGLGYIQRRYGTPCAAWSFKAANNWY